MDKPLRLMAVMAHPDDESLGVGGTLAKYAAEGVDTYLITATRGERGWTGSPAENPGLTGLGVLREAELRAACAVLGVCELHFMDYIDGDLDQAPVDEALGKIVGHLRRIRPDVVLTFDPFGAYGHPDHIAICQLTTTAAMLAADSRYDHPTEKTPHAIAKLYYMAASQEFAVDYQSVFGELVMRVDEVDRRGLFYPDWSITTRIDTRDYWKQVFEAVECHRTQLPNYQTLLSLDEAFHHRLWGVQQFYRAMSTVNGGRAVETDLFAGLRHG